MYRPWLASSASLDWSGMLAVHMTDLLIGNQPLSGTEKITMKANRNAIVLLWCFIFLGVV